MKDPDGGDGTDRIAVIVVNYGTADLAIEAVESILARQHGHRQVDVHLVDNASPNGDAEVLRAAHADRDWGARVTFWPETENHGFGRGNNVVLEALGAQATPPDKVFLLNPDARLENETIDLLAATLEADPQVAAVGASVLRPDLTPVTAAFRFPGPVNEMARMINLSLLNRIAQDRLVPLPPDHPAGPVDWVSGASVMFRFTALRDVGFFDPAFFLYYEEVDLMRRLHEKGWHVLYEPRARVVHEEGAATGQFAGSVGRQRDPAYLYQSWAHYFAQAYGRAGALSLAVLMLFAALLNILHRWLRGRPPTMPRSFISDQIRYVIRPLVFPESNT
ncbi:glycosyltransferase family 2 protein [Roseobacter sp. EG26]|uniref:glycosyltransferase family 2 protein n=1 Tax=Roseobacter sp. EG26 TaxID=3412477 RepID=UPI003CE4CB0B